MVSRPLDRPTQDRDADPGERPPQFWERPPRIVFAVVVAVAGAVLLFATSVPGIAFAPWLAAAITALLALLVWIVRAATYVVARSRGVALGSPWWFVIGPVIAALVIGLSFADVPLRVRFAMSQGAFEEVVEHAPEPESFLEEPLEAPGRIGWYDIDEVVQVGETVLFFERTGALFDFAGFAYLPDGPTPEVVLVLDDPRFRHLTGSWYAWTAGW